MFTKTDLNYYVDYDYDRTPCECDDYICRCTRIESTRVENVSFNKVYSILCKKYCKSASEIETYCFDRICSVFRLYDKYLYDVDVCGGYYGEEIAGVFFEKEEDIVNTYNEVTLLKNDIDKIKYVLELEYGYLLPSLEYAKNAHIELVETNLVFPPQREYLVKLNRDVIEEYKHRILPVCVCIKNNDQYTLIDGYHRFVANKENDAITIVVIE